MTNPNVSELATTTIESRTGSLANNVLKNTALLLRLSEKGKVKPVSGGTVIRQELSYAENSTFGFYDGYETLNISPSDVVTSAEYSPKQASVAVSMSGREEAINAGKEAIIDLLESRIENAEDTMKNGISTGVYSDGTGYSGKQIGGLQYLVADAPTSGTVGGINRANYSFWQNVKFGGVADGGTAVSSSNILSYMNRVYLQLVRGTDRPDLIVADGTYFRYYLESLQSIQRLGAETKMGEAGFQNLKYMNSDVVLDGGYGGAAPSAHMYFLNTKFLFYRTYANRNMKVLNGDRIPVNQDAFVRLVVWMGNLTMSNAILQGVLKA